MSQCESLLRLMMLRTCLADGVFVFPEVAKLEVDAYADKPYVYVAVLRPNSWFSATTAIEGNDCALACLTFCAARSVATVA